MSSPERFLLSRLPEMQAPADLMERVVYAVARARLRRLQFRLALLASGLVLSVGYALSNWSNFVAEAQTTSFFSLVRLAISDPDIVFANLQDLAYGLLESLPLGLLFFTLLGAFFLVGMAVFMRSLREQRHAMSHRHPLPTL